MKDSEIIESVTLDGYRLNFRQYWRLILSDLENISTKKSIIHYLSRLIFDFELHLIFSYRLSHYLYINKKMKVTQKILLYYQHVFHTCEIHPSVRIGKFIRFPHPQNIVIGQRSIIGNYVRVSQNVTLAGSRKKDQRGLFPIVRNNVRLYTGCILYGDVVVGMGSTVGAYAFVNRDVPDGCTVVGSPAEPVGKKHE